MAEAAPRKEAAPRRKVTINALTAKMRTALDTIRGAAGWFDEQRPNG